MKNNVLIRPEIRNGLSRVATVLAAGRSNSIHTVTPTQLVNDLLFEEWQRKYPGMMFPNEKGEIIPIECTPLLVKT